EDVASYGPDGFELPDDAVESAEAEAEAAAELAADSAFGAMEPSSVGELVDLYLEEQELDPSEEQLVRHALTSLVEQEYAADLDELSVLALVEGEGFDGGDAVIVGGYLSVVEQLAEGLPIRLRAPVEAVEWGEDGVVLSLQDRDEVVEADAVVLTLPLGVLQAAPPEFDPPLPEEKQDAIERLGMGTLDKVALRFPTAFWDDTAFVSFVNPEGSHFTEWLNLEPATGEPILIGFTAGSAAVGLEELSDEQVVDQAMDALRSIYED
ncbi:hypothetical protein B7486_58460, partial [cyanobacterium TDX16]